ncbi:MAG TPA: hypothetical protein VKE95_21885 [Burkholderiales bacterium]|nr:hypothetical protein [Burkholderiales bacterium]
MQQIHAQPKAVWGTLQLPFPSEELGKLVGMALHDEWQSRGVGRR